MANIRFTKYGSNAAFGCFEPGDRMTCGEALAAHLVNDAEVAKYEDAAPAAEPDTTTTPPKAAPRRGAKKDT